MIRLLDQVNSEITANSLGNSERILVDAVRICQSSSCSNPLKALIQVWIGFIHFVKGQNDLARNDIVSAKRLDPYIVLESSFFSPRFLEFFDSKEYIIKTKAITFVKPPIIPALNPNITSEVLGLFFTQTISNLNF